MTLMHDNLLIALENYFKFEIISQCDETKLHAIVYVSAHIWSYFILFCYVMYCLTECAFKFVRYKHVA